MIDHHIAGWSGCEIPEDMRETLKDREARWGKESPGEIPF